jgi:DnaJ-class molecular chaperone
MNYYDILGVSKSASPDELKAAFRKLAKEHHPDKGGDETKFKEINEAYNILSDPQKRSQYDLGGPNFSQNGGQRQYRSNSGPFEFNFDFGGNDFEDVLRTFGFNFRNAQQRAKNKDLHIRCQISLKDSYIGKTLNLNYNLPSGENQNIEVTVPEGVESGQVLRVSGYGDNSLKNLPRGDLHLTIDVLKDSVFKREGTHLIRKLEITIFEAMLGCVKKVQNINDKEIDLTIPPGAQHGQKFSCKGLGFRSVKFNNIKGDLIIELNVITPKIKDPVLVDLVNNLASEYQKSIS